MRFIHDIENKSDVMCSGGPYLHAVNHVPSKGGAFKASVHIMNINPITNRASAVEIEGNSDFIIQTAKDIISQLEALKTVINERN